LAVLPGEFILERLGFGERSLEFSGLVALLRALRRDCGFLEGIPARPILGFTGLDGVSVGAVRAGRGFGFFG
jgi:hypothetical protein